MRRGRVTLSRDKGKGHLSQEGTSRTEPPVNRQAPVKTLPSLKLRTLLVINCAIYYHPHPKDDGRLYFQSVHTLGGGVPNPALDGGRGGPNPALDRGGPNPALDGGGTASPGGVPQPWMGGTPTLDGGVPQPWIGGPHLWVPPQ